MDQGQARGPALYTAYLWRVLAYKQGESAPPQMPLSERPPDHQALVWTSSPLQAGGVCRLLALELDVKAGVYAAPGLESFGYPVALVPCHPGETLVVSSWAWIREMDSELVSRAGKHFPPDAKVEQAPEGDHRALSHAFFFNPSLARSAREELFRGVADGSIPVLGEVFVCAPPGRDLDPVVRGIGIEKGIQRDPDQIAALHYGITHPLVIWGAEYSPVGKA